MTTARLAYQWRKPTIALTKNAGLIAEPKMSDAELLRFGHAAKSMCSPDAYFGQPPRQAFLIQLEEARKEWQRRDTVLLARKHLLAHPDACKGLVRPAGGRTKNPKDHGDFMNRERDAGTQTQVSLRASVQRGRQRLRALLCARVAKSCATA